MSANSIYLASQGAQVTGIDISDQAIELARSKAANYSLPQQPVFQVSVWKAWRGRMAPSTM